MDKIFDLINNHIEVEKKEENTINTNKYASNIDFDHTDLGIINIKVMGVGGAGCNVIRYMCHYRTWPDNVQLYSINTDYGQLKYMKDEPCYKHLLAQNELHGTGSGGNPETGKNAVICDEESIRKLLKDTDLLFIVAGLGKGTGSGGSPEIAKIAKDMQICTVGIVNIPSIQAEGQEVYDNALNSLSKLIDNCDCISTISNDRIIGIDDEHSSMMDAFEKANHEVNRIIDTISNIINEASYINIDFADIRKFFTATKVFDLLPVSINNEEYNQQTLAQNVENVLKYSYCNIPINRVNNVLVNASLPKHTDKRLISDLKNYLVQLSHNEHLWLVNGMNESPNSKEIKMDIFVALKMTSEEMINNLNRDQNYSINHHEVPDSLLKEQVPESFDLPNLNNASVNLTKSVTPSLKTNTFIDVEQFNTNNHFTRSFHTTGRIRAEDLKNLKIN